MNFKPYEKHQLYKGYYEMSEGGVVRVPDKCYWIVRRHQGDGNFAPLNEPGQIALILNEDYEPMVRETDDYIEELRGGFWSVISFLTEDEAVSLAQQLSDAVSKTKRVSFTEEM